MTNWHADESCVNAGPPLFNTCNAQPGAGSYPARPAYAGSTTFTTDTADTMPTTSLPPPGDSITSPGVSSSGVNFQVQDVPLFNGNTYLSGLPTRANSASMSMSFWLETPAIDPLNFQGFIYGSGSQALQDYTQGNETFTQSATLGFSSFFASSPYASDDVQDGFLGDQGQTVSLRARASYATTHLTALAYGGQFTAAVSPSPTLYTELQTASSSFVSGTGPNPWVHVMFSIHSISSTTSQYMVYIDNNLFASGTSLQWTTQNGGVFPGSPTTAQVPLTFPFTTSGWLIGGSNWIPSSIYDGGFDPPKQQSATISGTRTGSCFLGCMAELWLAPGQYVDWSVQANREKFHTSESNNITGLYAPVNLGPNGAAPTGTKPLVYLSSNVNTAAGQVGSPINWFKVNRANGKKLLVNGDLIACSEAGPGSVS